MAGQILELAHSINPELAGSLANSVENPVARRTLTLDNTIKSLVNNPQSISNAHSYLDHQDLGYSAFRITKQLCSRTGGTIPESFVSEWMYRVADAPFREAHSVTTMAIQNQLIQKHKLKSPGLNQVYADLMDCLRLVYWIGNTLFVDITDNGYGIERNVAVPSNLETNPVRNGGELSRLVQDWLTTHSAEILVLCNSRFSPMNLGLLRPIAGHTEITILTSWSVQDYGHEEFHQLQDVYRQTWRESCAAAANMKILILEDDAGQFPIATECYVLDGKLGMEILPPVNSLDQNFAYTRFMSREEAHTFDDDVNSVFSLRPSFKGTRLRPLHIIQL